MTEVKDVEAISFSDMYVKAEKISTLVAMSVVGINSSLGHVDGVHEKKYFPRFFHQKPRRVVAIAKIGRTKTICRLWRI